MMRSSPIALVLVTAALSFPAFADSRVHRCVDPEGRVAYTQVACPAGHRAERVTIARNGARLAAGQCATARALATRVFADLKTGTPPHEIIEQHGGPDGIGVATLAVVNFAASLRYNRRLTPARAGALAFDRCREGGFGKLAAGDLAGPPKGRVAAGGPAATDRR